MYFRAKLLAFSKIENTAKVDFMVLLLSHKLYFVFIPSALFAKSRLNNAIDV